MLKNNPNKKTAGNRQKLLADLEAKYPHYNAKSNLLMALFFVGILLTIWEINIYRVTFISFYIPLLIWLLTGVLITPLFKKTFNIYFFNQYSPGNSSLFYHLFFNVVAFGGIAAFLFMWTNQSFTNHSKNLVTANIVSCGSLGSSRSGCAQPYVEIMYKGEEKQLVFDCGTEVKNYKLVYMETETGLFGFDVMTYRSLSKEQW